MDERPNIIFPPLPSKGQTEARLFLQKKQKNGFVLPLLLLALPSVRVPRDISLRDEVPPGAHSRGGALQFGLENEEKPRLVFSIAPLLSLMPSFFSLSVSLQRKQTNKQAKHAAIAEIVQELTALLEAGKDALKQEVIESLFFSFPIKTSTASRRGEKRNLKTSTQPKKKSNPSGRVPLLPLQGSKARRHHRRCPRRGPRCPAPPPPRQAHPHGLGHRRRRRDVQAAPLPAQSHHGRHLRLLSGGARLGL